MGSSQYCKSQAAQTSPQQETSFWSTAVKNHDQDLEIYFHMCQSQSLTAQYTEHMYSNYSIQ